MGTARPAEPAIFIQFIFFQSGLRMAKVLFSSDHVTPLLNPSVTSPFPHVQNLSCDRWGRTSLIWPLPPLHFGLGLSLQLCVRGKAPSFSLLNLMFPQALPSLWKPPLSPTLQFSSSFSSQLSVIYLGAGVGWGAFQTRLGLIHAVSSHTVCLAFSLLFLLCLVCLYRL